MEEGYFQANQISLMTFFEIDGRMTTTPAHGDSFRAENTRQVSCCRPNFWPFIYRFAIAMPGLLTLGQLGAAFAYKAKKLRGLQLDYNEETAIGRGSASGTARIWKALAYRGISLRSCTLEASRGD
jgi:hypothetical protein